MARADIHSHSPISFADPLGAGHLVRSAKRATSEQNMAHIDTALCAHHGERNEKYRYKRKRSSLGSIMHMEARIVGAILQHVRQLASSSVVSCGR